MCFYLRDYTGEDEGKDSFLGYHRYIKVKFHDFPMTK